METSLSDKKTLGFIILRHVNDTFVNQYWTHCYECIRKYYPENWILIIDDNSNQNCITQVELYNTRVIQSEFPGRGEILPYYYYLRNKLFDTAVILHDSVFINSAIDLNVDTYKMLWDFEHHWDQVEDETRMIMAFNDAELYQFHANKYLWMGCFGGMCIITHDYLTKVNSKYDISKLLEYILCRYNRCSFERVIACLLQIDHVTKPLLGNIHKYCPWEIRFYNKEHFANLPIIKVWTGR
jgi:hypothetical protein